MARRDDYDYALSVIDRIDHIQQEWFDGDVEMNVALSEIHSECQMFREHTVNARCFAVIVGSTLRGPLYCGSRAKGTDANGRPTCGVHGNKQVGVEWFGIQGRFPHGFGGDWSFGRGEPK